MDKLAPALSNRTKVKLGFGLIVLIILLMVANKFEEDNLTEIDRSFDSIFEDRLVPATSIFEMRENLYQKRVLLEKVIRSRGSEGKVPAAMIADCNRKMDSLLAMYKQTFFLEQETDYLLDLEKDLARYDGLEAEVLMKAGRGEWESASAAFATAGVQFDDAVLQLSNLNHIQSEIGKGLVVEEKGTVASLKVLFRLETGLILLIALILQVLIRSSFVARGHPLDRFHLN